MLPAYIRKYILTWYRTSYSGSSMHTFVTAGLLYLQFNKSENWSSPWHSSLPVSTVYLVTNIFITIVPFIPPAEVTHDEDYPYFVTPMVSTGLLSMGVIYWAIRFKLMPRWGGYRMEAELHRDMNGCDYNVYKKVHIEKQA